MAIENEFRKIKLEVTVKLDGAMDQNLWNLGTKEVQEALKKALGCFITPDVHLLYEYDYSKDEE